MPRPAFHKRGGPEPSLTVRLTQEDYQDLWLWAEELHLTRAELARTIVSQWVGYRRLAQGKPANGKDRDTRPFPGVTGE